MAQRWVTEEEYNQMFENGGDVQQKNPLQQFFEQLPPELQQKIQMLPPEKQQEVLMELMQRNQQASNQSVEQFPLGGLIGRRRSDDNGFDDFMKNAFYDPSGKLFLNQQSYDRYIQFMYPNQQQQAQQPYSFQIPQINIDINKFKPIFKRNHFAEGGSTEDEIPVEAERNETLTTQDGTQPDVDGGYLEQKSYNPVSGQSTYEIPDNKHNQTHPEGGVSMMLKEGDVVNSDKTKIPTDFKVYGKNFKGKTFKEASDFLSKKEEDTQKQLEELEKEGKADKVTENSVSIMLAKLAIDRNNLNDLQEQVLESKKQKEYKDELNSSIKQFGGLVKNATKSEEVYNKTLDRFLNGYTTERPVLKAEKGLSASISKMQSFTDKISANPKMSTKDVMSAFQQSGLYRQPSDNTFINKFSQIPSSYNPLSISTSYSPTSFKNKKGNITDDALIRKSIQYAGDIKVDPALGLAIIDIESKGNKDAKSPTGAEGYMQLTKGTAKQYGLDPNERSNPDKNLQVGFKLLKDNYYILQKNGIEPTPINIYLAHQQGIRGAIEIISNAVNGTPISESVRKNMGYNWGDKSGAEYLRITSNKIMPLYNYYSNVLTKKDEQYSLDAHTLKNKFSLYGDPLEIKNNILKNGVKGFLQKIKTGTTNLASNSYNTNEANPQSFEHGGKILASKGFNFRNVSDFNEKNWNDLNTNAQRVLGRTFKDPEEYQSYMLNNYPDLIREMFHKGYWSNTNQGKSNRTSTIPFDDEELKHAFLDKKYNRRGFIPETKTFDNIESYQQYIKGKTKVGGNYYFDPELNTWVSPDINENYYSQQSQTTNQAKPNTPTPAPPTEREGTTSNEPPKEPATNTPTPKEPSSKDITYKTPKKSSILDKLGYGLRESLPYLDNLRLLMEGRIMPTLQQKPYQNPYDNLTTDVNIQSALNDIDRQTLTGIADSTGNPSVRNARIAQLVANAQASKSPLYTQKYNQEKQLENQKTLGQMSYLNQWEDTNRDLRKKYEQEVLQTIENQRQQQHMAINKMMNDYLRKQESDQSRDLALLETNYDWNPYTGKFEFNPEKAIANFAYKKATFSNNDEEAKYWKKKYLKLKGIDEKKYGTELWDLLF